MTMINAIEIEGVLSRCEVEMEVDNFLDARPRADSGGKNNFFFANDRVLRSLKTQTIVRLHTNRTTEMR